MTKLLKFTIAILMGAASVAATVALAGEISGTGRIAEFAGVDIRKVEVLKIKDLGLIRADEVKEFIVKTPQSAYELGNLVRVDLWSGKSRPVQAIETVTVRLPQP